MLCAQPGAAQVAPSADSQSSREAIVVTAQRRPEQPEDVPISLTALSGEHLDPLDAAQVE